jgi:uncharacterized SAM-binding protein YcdF (DUF218 family)
MIFARQAAAKPILKPRMWRALVGITLLLGVWELLAFGAARLLIVRTPLQHAGAIVVLSGSSAYRERAKWAAELYKRGLAPKIILTNDNEQGGWSNTLQRNPFFVEDSQNVLVDSGVPRNAIEVLWQPVSSTHDEAMLLESYCHEHNLPSILLVTSAYHSRRAQWTFQRVLNSTHFRVGVDPVKAGTRAVATWWLDPVGWKTVPVEYMKLFYYRVYF